MKELYILANKLGFVPQDLSISWKIDSYLWMCELQKWLREKHNIYCSAWCNASGWAWEIEKTNGTHISIMNIDGNVKGVNLDSGMFNSYEEALEDGLLEALKILN